MLNQLGNKLKETIQRRIICIYWTNYLDCQVFFKMDLQFMLIKDHSISTFVLNVNMELLRCSWKVSIISTKVKPPFHSKL